MTRAFFPNYPAHDRITVTRRGRPVLYAEPTNTYGWRVTRVTFKGDHVTFRDCVTAADLGRIIAYYAAPDSDLRWVAVKRQKFA